MWKRKGLQNQIFVTVFANITSLVYGCVISWTSPNLPLLESLETPLDTGPISGSEESWIGALACFGGLASTVIFGWLADTIGRKKSIMLIGIPQIASWVYILLGTKIIHVYIARFLGGVAGGGTFILVPMYISEISDVNIRGALCSLLSMTCNMGILLGFLMCTYLSYYMVPLIIIGLSVVFLVGFSFAPESPCYLAINNRLEESEKALRYFRGVTQKSKSYLPEKYLIELDELKRLAETQTNKLGTNNKLELADFCSRASKKGFFISIILMTFPGLCGCFVIISYGEKIFTQAGSTLDPATSAIIVAVIQLFGSYFATFLIEKAGRRMLLIISCFGCSLSLFVMGANSYVRYLGYELGAFNIIPVISFSVLVFIAAIGMVSLPFIMVNELVSQKIRGVVATVCLFELWILGFVILKIFPSMIGTIGLHGAMWFFSFGSLFSGIFVYFCLPETKGKSIDQIIEILSGKFK